MEKGFNDDELADIMNEIESLEKEFTEEVDSKSNNSDNDKFEAAAEDSDAYDAEQETLSETDEMAAELEAMAESDDSFDEADSDDDADDDMESLAEDAFEEDSFEEDSFQEDSFEEDVLDAKPVLDEQAPILEAPKAAVTKQEVETLHKVANLPIDQALPEVSPMAKIHHVEESFKAKGPEHTGKSAKTSMSFNVQGDMCLNLSFNISGKIVELSVNDNGLELELDGGMKFSVPLDVSQKGKKAA